MRIAPAIACLALLAAVPAFGAEDLIAERRAVLEKIVSVLESRYLSGLGSDVEVGEARMALYVFERDAATEVSHRIAWQQKIVKYHEDQIVILKGKAAAGLGNDLDMLRARERLLAARLDLVAMQKS